MGTKLAITRHRVLSKTQNSILLHPPINFFKGVHSSILSSIVLNDSIEIDTKTEKDQIKILPRKNRISRFEKVEKRIATNIDHFFLVVTNYPSFNLLNCAKIIVRSISQNIPFTVIVNKVDRPEVDENFKEKVEALTPYQHNLTEYQKKARNFCQYLLKMMI